MKKLTAAASLLACIIAPTTPSLAQHFCIIEKGGGNVSCGPGYACTLTIERSDGCKDPGTGVTYWRDGSRLVDSDGGRVFLDESAARSARRSIIVHKGGPPPVLGRRIAVANEANDAGELAVEPTNTASPRLGIDPRTGSALPDVGGGAIDPRTGQFYPDIGPGYINPATGEFMPKLPPKR